MLHRYSGIGTYTTIMYNEIMGYSSHKLPLLLERVGVRGFKKSANRERLQ